MNDYILTTLDVDLSFEVPFEFSLSIVMLSNVILDI
jgi:hypothetical protein